MAVTVPPVSQNEYFFQQKERFLDKLFTATVIYHTFTTPINIRNRHL